MALATLRNKVSDDRSKSSALSDIAEIADRELQEIRIGQRPTEMLERFGSSRRGVGVGLVGMSERVRELGGLLSH